MLNKTIIAIYGRKGEGKSEAIKESYKTLISRYPNIIHSDVDYSGDILTTVQFGSFKIGFESQGDPGSRIVNAQDKLLRLAYPVANTVVIGPVITAIPGQLGYSGDAGSSSLLVNYADLARTIFLNN